MSRRTHNLFENQSKLTYFNKKTKTEQQSERRLNEIEVEIEKGHFIF